MGWHLVMPIDEQLTIDSPQHMRSIIGVYVYQSRRHAGSARREICLRVGLNRRWEDRQYRGPLRSTG